MPKRCGWVKMNNPLYVAYHDEEWGQPVHDDGKLFELLLLECFQAGLSWECVLNKREGFRRAFAGFDLEKVCAFTEEDVERLMQDAAIIRHRRKIEAAIGNARVFHCIQQEFGSFDCYLWHWTGGSVVFETGKVSSNLSDAVSRDLKKRGMKFVGSTVIYSYLQAIGVLNAHGKECGFCAQEPLMAAQEPDAFS